MRDYSYAQNDDIEVRVDFSRPGTSVDYRFDRFDDDDWTPSPFQSADVNHLGLEGVLNKVSEYLDSL